VVELARDAKVGDLDVAVRVDQQVGRLDVAMDDVLLTMHVAAAEKAAAGKAGGAK
jgi:hypothetical protein